MELDKIKEQFNNCAEKYDNRRKTIIPCFDEFYNRSVSLLKYYKENFVNIIDLGAGTGLLTKVIFEMYPNANFTLIDISENMLKIAKERFNGMDNFKFLDCNYVEDIPINDCDLICSALSIHHLEHDEKQKLYQNVYSKLIENGCFINLDIFIAKSEIINNQYNSWWYNYVKNSGMSQEEEQVWLESQKIDKENTINETIEMLRKSGFNNIECIYNFMKFGVIVAIK